ncbi:MAG: zinc ribbon domain-containing protein [Deltaproteobacteria bacterium]|nr:zinc ribbon domain-containing protein [Deltaproteobacteria bacterium]MBW2218578.1 zinc ribbon domain-containing protein [Deltaproteobacteria bacterium]
MPIYEFKCLKCDDFFELLVINDDDKTKMACPKCSSEDFERVISATNFTMTGNAPGGNKGAASQTRTCSGGSCTTYDIPGPK